MQQTSNVQQKSTTKKSKKQQFQLNFEQLYQDIPQKLSIQLQVNKILPFNICQTIEFKEELKQNQQYDIQQIDIDEQTNKKIFLAQTQSRYIQADILVLDIDNYDNKYDLSYWNNILDNKVKQKCINNQNVLLVREYQDIINYIDNLYNYIQDNQQIESCAIDIIVDEENQVQQIDQVKKQLERIKILAQQQNIKAIVICCNNFELVQHVKQIGEQIFPIDKFKLQQEYIQSQQKKKKNSGKTKK